MLNASFDAPKRLLQFTSFFRRCFTSRSYASFAFYLSGMLLEHRRLSIESIAAKAPLAVYGRLQYFISESKWSTDGVMSGGWNTCKADAPSLRYPKAI